MKQQVKSVLALRQEDSNYTNGASLHWFHGLCLQVKTGDYLPNKENEVCLTSELSYLDSWRELNIAGETHSSSQPSQGSGAVAGPADSKLGSK